MAVPDEAGGAMMADKYMHRNGEMDAPTESGIYFFQGLPGSGWTEGVAEIEPHGMEDKLVVWRAWVDGWDYLPQATVRWWGPIIPPWRE